MLGAFRNATEGTDGYDTLKASFPEGALGPATVIVDRQDGPIHGGRRRGRPGGARARCRTSARSPMPTGQSEDGQAAAFNVAFPDDPYSNEALDRTDEMRDALAALGPELQGYVGGVSAIHGRLPRRRPARRPARSCRSCCS